VEPLVYAFAGGSAGKIFFFLGITVILRGAAITAIFVTTSFMEKGFIFIPPVLGFEGLNLLLLLVVFVYLDEFVYLIPASSSSNERLSSLNSCLDTASAKQVPDWPTR